MGAEVITIKNLSESVEEYGCWKADDKYGFWKTMKVGIFRWSLFKSKEIV